MRLRISRHALAIWLAIVCVAAKASGAPACGAGGAALVMVIPSVHKLMLSNPHYSYARLYDIVASFHPDVVGVEIRQEDLARAGDYLKRNYPREMVELAGAYRGRVFGFDWLGDELAGMPIPDDWWAKRSRIKQLERDFDASPPPADDRLKQLDLKLTALSDRRDAIESTASPEELASGPYDKVAADYYATTAMLTRGTRFALLPQWYEARDRHLADSVTDAIRRHPGCRIIIVTGADHHGPVSAAVAASGKARLVPVP